MSDRSSPIFYVLIQPEGKGEADRVDTTDTILSFEFEDDEKKADMLKLEVDNWDLSNFDNPVWQPGNTLIVTWGYYGHMTPQRECIIQKVTGATKLTVTALAKSILMNKVTKNRTFGDLTRSDIVEQIAIEHGYSEDKRDIEPTETVYETVSQSRMTDAQFIKKLADAEHFEFYVDFDGLHWHPRRLGKKPLRALQYYLPPDVGDIIEFDVENDIFAKPGKVTKKGRDPLKKQDVTGEGSNGSTERDQLQSVVKVIDEATGVATFQTRAASEDTHPTTETNKAQAKKEADGAYKRSVLTTVKLKVEMVGDPGIAAKSVIEIRGISKRLSGLYYITKATHKIDSGGYKLSLNCATDGTSGHSENLLNADASAKPTPASLEACKKEFRAKQNEILEAQKRGDSDAVARLTKEGQAIDARCKALAAAVGKGKSNDGKADGADPNASKLVKKVDPATGSPVIEYHPDKQDDVDKTKKG